MKTKIRGYFSKTKGMIKQNGLSFGLFILFLAMSIVVFNSCTRTIGIQNAKLTLEIQDNTNRPINDAIISLTTGDDGKKTHQQFYDRVTNGVYEFTGLTPGNYELKVDVDGYAPILSGGSSSTGGETGGEEGGSSSSSDTSLVQEFDISSGQNYRYKYKFQKSLQYESRIVVISVVDDSGQPIPNVAVEIAETASGQTNAEGDVRLTNVPVGESILKIFAGSTYQLPNTTSTSDKDVIEKDVNVPLDNTNGQAFPIQIRLTPKDINVTLQVSPDDGEYGSLLGDFSSVTVMINGKTLQSGTTSSGGTGGTTGGTGGTTGGTSTGTGIFSGTIKPKSVPTFDVFKMESANGLNIRSFHDDADQSPNADNDRKLRDAIPGSTVDLGIVKIKSAGQGNVQLSLAIGNLDSTSGSEEDGYLDVSVVGMSKSERVFVKDGFGSVTFSNLPIGKRNFKITKVAGTTNNFGGKPITADSNFDGIMVSPNTTSYGELYFTVGGSTGN